MSIKHTLLAVIALSLTINAAAGNNKGSEIEIVTGENIPAYGPYTSTI